LQVLEIWKSQRAKVEASDNSADLAHGFGELTGDLFYRAVWAKLAASGDVELQRLNDRVQARPLPVRV
jgi:hypothetical protein